MNDHIPVYRAKKESTLKKFFSEIMRVFLLVLVFFLYKIAEFLISILAILINFSRKVVVYVRAKNRKRRLH